MLNLFRARSASRDQATDDERAGRVHALLRAIMGECEAEEQGLLKRHKAAQEEAASVLGWLEGERPDGKDPRLDAHEKALVYCETRIAALRRERQALERCRDAFERARSL